MNSVTPTNAAVTRDGLSVATVEIKVDKRRDALDLLAALTPFHSFIVQHDRQHWVVHARVPGHNDRTLHDLATAIARWGPRVDVSQLACVLGDRVVGRSQSPDVVGEEAAS